MVNADTLSFGQPIYLRKGNNNIKLRMKELHLSPGLYTVGLCAANTPMEIYDYITSAFMIEVVETEAKKIRVPGDGLVSCGFVLLDR